MYKCNRDREIPNPFSEHVCHWPMACADQRCVCCVCVCVWGGGGGARSCQQRFFFYFFFIFSPQPFLQFADAVQKYLAMVTI